MDGLSQNKHLDTQWIDVGSPDDVAPQGARRIETPSGLIGIFKTLDGKVFAIDDRCPHKGGPLSEGIVHGKAIACPLHNWSISLETGEALGADAGQGCVHTYQIKVENGRLFLKL